MKRKVIKQGNGTLTITLPKKWAVERRLKGGEDIDVSETGQSLIVSSSFMPQQKEHSLSVDNPDSFMKRFLWIPYLKGYDTIRIKFRDAKTYEKIVSASNSMMGFEIIESGQDSCKIVNVSSALEQNFDVLVRRLFMNVTTFAKELSVELQSSKRSWGRFNQYETTINRIALFCRRILHKGRRLDYDISVLALYSIIMNLEISADCLRHIIEKVEGRAFKPSKRAMELFSSCVRLNETTFELFNKVIKNEKQGSCTELLLEHKRIRDRAQNLDHFKEDALNSFVCSQLWQMIEMSHHITEELFV